MKEMSLLRTLLILLKIHQTLKELASLSLSKIYKEIFLHENSINFYDIAKIQETNFIVHCHFALKK